MKMKQSDNKDMNKPYRKKSSSSII